MTASDLIVAGFRDHPWVGKGLLALAALWAAKSSDVLWWIWRGVEAVAFESMEFVDQEAVVPIVWFLARNSRRTHLDGRHMDAVYAPIISLGERRLVFSVRAVRSNILLWYRGRPIHVAPVVPGTQTEAQKPARLRWIRGTVDMKRLLEDVDAAVAPVMREADRERSERIGTGFRVIRVFGRSSDGVNRHEATAMKDAYPSPQPTGGGHLTDVAVTLNGRGDGDVTIVNHQPDDIGTASDVDAMTEIAVAPESRVVLGRIDFWAERRDWYKKRRVPWRLGLLLHGSPGTGKTTFVRAVAKHLDVPLYTLDLSSMDNRDFENAWRESRVGGARIVLLEDFDTVFHGRENVSLGSRLTFDSILNMISGIEAEDGLLLVVTTNNIEHIDPALGKTDAVSGQKTRPGRIDIIHEIGALDEAGRRQIAESILIGESGAIEEVLAAGASDTAAQFTERCVEAAIQVLQREERKIA